MKNIYKKIARKIFMHAFNNELVKIGKEIRQEEELIIAYDLDSYHAMINKTLGKLDILKRLDLLS